MMRFVRVKGIEEMRSLIGREIGPTEWRTIRQADIDAFAELSGDHQWIHVDPERASADSPYGTTIAHGNLTLATIDGFRSQLISRQGFVLAVNYGWNKVRFPAPVLVDSRIRSRAEVTSVEDKGGDWYEVITRFTLEVDGNEKPCFAGESVTRLMVAEKEASSHSETGIPASPDER